VKITRADAVLGKHSNWDVEEISAEDVADALATNSFSAARSQIIKAGTKAASGSAMHSEEQANDEDPKIIPRNKCVLIEFDKEATLYENDNGPIITDGETHIEFHNESAFGPPGEDDMSIILEREEEIDLVSVGM